MKARGMGHGVRKIAELFIAAAAVAVMTAGASMAGESPTTGPDTPRGPQGSATLQDLYDRLSTGSETLSLPGGSTFQEPAAGPTTPTMKTIDEIMGVAPKIDALGSGAGVSEVCSGYKFWGLKAVPGWGALMGTMDCLAPTFTSSPGTGVNEDAPYSYTPTTSEAATISVVTKPSFLTFSGGVLSGTPTNANVGSHPVVLTVADARGWTAVQSWTLTVANVNDDPVGGTDDVTAYEEIPVTFNVLANDTDPDPGEVLTVTATTTPANGAISRVGGVITYTSSANFSGSDSFDYTLSDGDVTRTVAVNVSVVNVNDAPSFTIADPARSATFGSGQQTVNDFATAISAGPGESAQTPSFGISCSNTAALFSANPSVDVANGRLTYTPLPSGTAGVSVCTLTLSDDGGTAWGGVNASAQRFFISIY